ncbi:MAG TPA: thioredoxin domain-containing protein [Thermoanaerobaculia bacterium]|jgi:protein-disulfide isomerase|nr:thioredoxin domain-containing protein [Thermoanaerobaculia bacterium]
MKKLSLIAISILVCASAFAAPAEPTAPAPLMAYARKAALHCPDNTVTLKPVPPGGPLNFNLYEMFVKSADESCSEHKYFLYSPGSQQVLIGTVFQIPEDNRPVMNRLADQASQLLHEPVTATISPFPLADGLKLVALTRQTPFGPFSYHGYLDASERFMIVARRGKLGVDPGKSLKEALGVEHAVSRGNPVAKTEIVELSDFECPTCGRMHAQVEPIITKHLSKVHYLRLDLPLFEHHEWAIYAALGAHAIHKVAPAAYWEYADFVFKNQEEISKQPFDKVLQNFCEDHDIAWAKILPLYKSNEERAAILDGVSRAFDNGLNSTPTFIINGQLMGFGKEGAVVLDAIKAALK